ncbi:MAG TPA: branched-chain amino acid ABC transporter permease [Pseudolysinimonas sp.]|nr:branched-chain amino acid ABC transporter permease [Pseudolysinimonas sp.]
MELLFQQLVNGLAVGSQYALWAVGYGVVYQVLGLMHFAHGDTIVFAGLVAFTLVVAGLPFWLAVVAAAIVGAVIAILIEKFAYAPLMARKQTFLAFVAALGAAYILRNIGTAVWGVETQVFPVDILPDPVVAVGGVSIRLFPIVSLVIAIGVVVAFQLFLDRARGGHAIRAVAQDREVASLMGISTGRVVALIYALSAAIGVLGLALYVGNTRTLTVGLGFAITLKAFVAVVIGGMGSIRGTVAAGIAIGVLESMVATYISTRAVDLVVFLVLIVALIIRPQGFAGRSAALRA